MEIWHTIRIGRSSLRLISMPLVVIRMAILTSSRLRHVWNDLHPTWNNARRSTTSSGICRSCWATKSFSQLLNQSLPHVIGGNMNSIGDTKNDQRTFR